MKKILSVYILLVTLTSFGQDNQPWRSFFSYNDIVDVTQSGGMVYGAAGSAMFSKSLGTNELKTITSVDGLKVETITAIHHSTAYKKTLVGNNNGLLLVINADNTIINKIDIIQETTVAAAKKKINHIYEFEGKAYISCDFGIAVFNLATMEFGDTYYIGPNGAEIPVVQCAVLNGNIYAASPDSGIWTGFLGNPNLNDFSQWSNTITSNGNGIIAYAGSLFVTNDTGTVSRVLPGGGLQFFTQFPTAVVDIREANGNMVITTSGRVTVYNDLLLQVFQVNFIPGHDVIFTCATVVSDILFIGTKQSGVFSVPFNNAGLFENITPDGPLLSNIFALAKTPNFLWATYGAYSYAYEPDYSQKGISKFTQQGWLNIPYVELIVKNAPAEALVDITVNPTNENQVYFSSYHSGLLKMENDEPTILYNSSNSPLESQMFLPGFVNVRVNGGVFDKKGNLWLANSMTLKALKVLKADGQWGPSYSFEDITENTIEDNYGKIAIDKNGTKWIPSFHNGVIAFNENPQKIIIINEQSGNLPSRIGKCVAIDKSNRLWIGTDRGLRVLPGIDRFNTEETLTTNPVIIIEDGLAQELMYEQSIIDIVVDGANNKWFATASAGAFLVSPDGQKTLFHFTKENSPLPSNTINDIEIDSVTGEVFFATDKGMVSYRGTSTEAADDLSKVYVFPNPVRPGFEGDVNISGLMDAVNLKITDIEGNLVHEATSEGGTVLWDTRAFGKYKVASGVYMIFISSEDGTKTKVKKVMIVR